jgi:hypothetical protein
MAADGSHAAISDGHRREAGVGVNASAPQAARTHGFPTGKPDNGGHCVVNALLECRHGNQG